MTINFEAAGVHGVNKFLWDKLQSDLGWDKKNYGGMIPIITPQQTQEFNDEGHPYIVYNYRITETGTDFYHKKESIVYVIYGSDERDIRKALNLIDYYFTSYDDSAQLVNTYIQGQTSTVFKEFLYTDISAPQITGAAPAGQEGGIQDATASVYIKYTRERMLEI